MTGTSYLVGNHPLGPFNSVSDEFLIGDEIGSRYSGKIIKDPNGKWILMTSRMFAVNGDFLGEIADPLFLKIGPDGRLLIA